MADPGSAPCLHPQQDLGGEQRQQQLGTNSPWELTLVFCSAELKTETCLQVASESSSDAVSAGPIRSAAGESALWNWFREWKSEKVEPEITWLFWGNSDCCHGNDSPQILLSVSDSSFMKLKQVYQNQLWSQNLSLTGFVGASLWNQTWNFIVFSMINIIDDHRKYWVVSIYSLFSWTLKESSGGQRSAPQGLEPPPVWEVSWRGGGLRTFRDSCWLSSWTAASILAYVCGIFLSWQLA